MQKVIEKGKHKVVFLFLILCPAFFLSSFIEPSNVPRFIAFSLVALATVLLSFRGNALVMPPPRILYLLLGIYGLNLLSVFWALNVADALYESQKFFLIICCLIVYLSWLKTEGKGDDLLRSMILVGFIYGLIMGIRFFSIGKYSVQALYDLTLFHEHRNFLASFIFLLLSFPVYGFLSFEGRWKIISFLLAIILFSLLVLMQVRSIYLAFIFSFLFLIIAGRKLIVLSARTKWSLSLATVSLSLFYLYLNKGFGRAFSFLSYASSESAVERLKVWQKTWLLIKEYPWFGVGAGNWQYNYAKNGIGNIDNISKNAMSFQYPHNDLLCILAETGVFALVLTGLFMLLFAKMVLTQIRVHKNLKVLVFSAFLLGIFIDSCFSFPKEHILHILLSTVILAVILNETKETTQVNTRIQKAFITFLVAGLVFNMIIGGFRLRGEYYTQHLLKSQSRGEARQVIAFSKKAISPFYTTDPTSSPILSYMGWGYTVLGLRDSTELVSKLACDLVPYDHEALSNYGYALMQNGKTAEAKNVILEALRIDPFYETALINMVALEYNSKQYEEAMRWFKRIPDQEQKYPDYQKALLNKLKK